ncbi:MAG: hypothetical protein U1E78_08790 [Gammaproteobacteria bacterium]
MWWQRLFKRRLSYSFNQYLTSIRLHIARCLDEKGWKRLDEPHQALFHDEYMELDDVVSAHLEQKHLLWGLLRRHQLDCMPLTFPMNDLTYPKVLEDIRATVKEAIPIWFLKPALLNNGDEIVLLNDINQVADYFRRPKHLEGDHVLQRAVHPPALMEGRKFTFRLSGILTNEPGVYLYDTGYLNISALRYEDGADLTLKKRHVTNYLIEGNIAGIEQRLSSEYPQFKTQIYPKMMEIVKSTVLALLSEYPNYLRRDEKAKFEIFGFDFMLDQANRLWLIEINQGPDFPVDPNHPLFDTLWDPFWHDVTDNFVLPLFAEITKAIPHRQRWVRLV